MADVALRLVHYTCLGKVGVAGRNSVAIRRCPGVSSSGSERYKTQDTPRHMEKSFIVREIAALFLFCLWQAESEGRTMVEPACHFYDSAKLFRQLYSDIQSKASTTGFAGTVIF